MPPVPEIATLKAKQTIAYIAVATALRKGTLSKAACETCGNPHVEAHHEDYDRPLDIRWLCHRCHMGEHAAMALARGGRKPQRSGYVKSSEPSIKVSISLPGTVEAQARLAAKEMNITFSALVSRALKDLPVIE